MSLSAIFGATLTGAGLASIAASSPVSFDSTTGTLRLALTGAGTYTIDLAMMPVTGCRVVVVQLDPLDNAGTPITAPITVGWTSNSVAKTEELTATTNAPGLFAIFSPSPVHGITALSIVTTANAVVHVTALG